ncbi:HNH endonuclease [Pararhizobium gei]|uniref:HNH endonuclease n=1 Tax=Pararhizobium gei TaxID=1395951 RepID=UPI0023D98F9D|nr:HNH endonuclease [Rhizobium gei]
MPMDPEKKRPVEKNEFVRIDITVEPRVGGKTGAFSAAKHRYYTPMGLAGNARQERIAPLLETVARFSEQTGENFPYAFTDRQGKNWSIDAGCLNAIGPHHLGLVDFVEEDGYIIAVTPTSALVSRESTSSPKAADIEQLQEDSSLGITERKRLIDARLGQGRFRRDVLACWNGRCAVTSCALPAVLRASHIVPWRDADNAERLAPENGLPLVATLDALFDAGLISFDNSGRMLRSPGLSEHPDLVQPGLKLSRPPTSKMQAYLDRHRRHHGF